MTTHVWHVASMGNHQGLIVDETTGENIAVAYDKANAPLIATAPELLALAREFESYLDLKLIGFRREYPEDHCADRGRRRIGRVSVQRGPKAAVAVHARGRCGFGRD